MIFDDVSMLRMPFYRYKTSVDLAFGSVPLILRLQHSIFSCVFANSQAETTFDEDGRNDMDKAGCDADQKLSEAAQLLPKCRQQIQEPFQETARTFQQLSLHNGAPATVS